MFNKMYFSKLSNKIPFKQVPNLIFLSKPDTVDKNLENKKRSGRLVEVNYKGIVYFFLSN